jgi:aminoglycoside phosphotransferase (APT) family kinase protein
VKFAIRDQRDRAGREYKALLALHQAQLPLAPKPVLLDQERYVQPVIVQTWLEGEVMTTPPASEVDWQSLVAHYVAIHTLKQDSGLVELPLAVLSAKSVKTAREIVEQQVAHLPKETQPASLQRLLRQFGRTQFPDWPEPPLVLCRVDPNPLNFIRRPGLWGSVDWENSGWGDPAFEIADLMTHPAYLDVSASQ